MALKQTDTLLCSVLKWILLFFVCVFSLFFSFYRTLGLHSMRCCIRSPNAWFSSSWLLKKLYVIEMQCYNYICSMQRPHYIMHIATSAHCTPKLSITKSQNWNEFVYFTNFEPLFVHILQQVMLLLLQLFHLSVQSVSLMQRLVSRKRRQKKSLSWCLYSFNLKCASNYSKIAGLLALKTWCRISATISHDKCSAEIPIGFAPIAKDCARNLIMKRKLYSMHSCVRIPVREYMVLYGVYVWMCITITATLAQLIRYIVCVSEKFINIHSFTGFESRKRHQYYGLNWKSTENIRVKL